MSGSVSVKLQVVNPFPALVTSYAVTAKVIPSSTKTSQDVLYELTVHACSEAAEF